MPKARREHGLRAIVAARKALAAQTAAGDDPRRSAVRSEAIAEAHQRNRRWAREHPGQRDKAWFKREIAPKLDAFSLEEIGKATGLSLAACSRVRAGAKVPHPLARCGPVGAARGRRFKGALRGLDRQGVFASHGCDADHGSDAGFPEALLRLFGICILRRPCERARAQVPVPVVYTDFLSQYSSVNVLMGLWQLATATEIRVIEDCREELAALLRDVTPEWVLNASTGTVVPDGMDSTFLGHFARRQRTRTGRASERVLFCLVARFVLPIC
jgi:hypothetical protein